jgi:hypothetical protein
MWGPPKQYGGVIGDPNKASVDWTNYIEKLWSTTLTSGALFFWARNEYFIRRNVYEQILQQQKYLLVNRSIFTVH